MGVSLNGLRNEPYKGCKGTALNGIGNYAKGLACSAAVALALAGGCGEVRVERSPNPGKIEFSVTDKPKIRLGYLPCPRWGTKFLGPGDLGSHGYGFRPSEKNGVVYTRMLGHIDLAHLRKSADWTAFLAAKTLENLKEKRSEFSFKLYEPSCYFVQLTYPENWEGLPEGEREDIAYGASIMLGQYFAYTAGVWHEILTWFGFNYIGFEEFPSSFSWEDLPSNLLGVHLAGEALRDTGHGFDEAITLALDKKFEQLGIQSSGTARRASESVRGEWFSGSRRIDMKKRNLDIGLDDGSVTPIVPYVSECGGDPQPYPVPNLGLLSEYGFSLRLEIEPREWERDRILDAAYPEGRGMKSRIEPAVHFAPIMEYIKKDALEMGYDID